VISVVVDVDDTIVNTQRRIQGVWRYVLGHEIPLQAIESLSSRQILEKFGSSNKKLWKRFWKVLLCSEEVGLELLKLDKPITFAADVLQRWSKQCMLIYLTGRPQNMRDLTFSELEKFGFPTERMQLEMFSLQDWADFSSVGSLVEARFRLFSSISKQHNVIRVIDDTPRFFTVYQQFDVPDRIGLLRPKRFSPQDYLSQGATRVVETWKQLEGDLLTPIM
jgi:hypothetical protein